MIKFKKTELVLLELIGQNPKYTVLRCDDHGICATSCGTTTCYQCKKDLKPLDVAESIKTKSPVYAVPAEI